MQAGHALLLAARRTDSSSTLVGARLASSACSLPQHSLARWLNSSSSAAGQQQLPPAQGPLVGYRVLDLGQVLLDGSTAMHKP
jgi:hypothetical protein